MQVKKIGDEFWAHVVKCKDPKACTIVLRGASKDILNEVERNLQVCTTLTPPGALALLHCNPSG